MADVLAASAIRRAYWAGVAITTVVALAGQGFLHRVPTGQGPLEAVQQIGYTFTGLCLLGAVLLARRTVRSLASRKNGPAGERVRFAGREYLLIASACASSALLGIVYWGLGGRGVERHARTFIALAPVAFLALAPRPGRWLRPDST